MLQVAYTLRRSAAVIVAAHRAIPQCALRSIVPSELECCQTQRRCSLCIIGMFSFAATADKAHRQAANRDVFWRQPAHPASTEKPCMTRPKFGSLAVPLLVGLLALASAHAQQPHPPAAPPPPEHPAIE